MPLLVSGLSSELGGIFAAIDKDQTPAKKAQKFANAMQSYVKSGIPFTMDEGSFASLVAAATVIAPGQSGSGNGKCGIDNPSEGGGLDKSALAGEFESILSDVSSVATAQSKGSKFATAMDSYFTEVQF